MWVLDALKYAGVSSALWISGLTSDAPVGASTFLSPSLTFAASKNNPSTCAGSLFPAGCAVAAKTLLNVRSPFHCGLQR